MIKARINVDTSCSGAKYDVRRYGCTEPDCKRRSLFCSKASFASCIGLDRELKLSKLRDQISRVGEQVGGVQFPIIQILICFQHGVSLALAVSSFETSLSEGLTNIFDVAQERQIELDLVAVDEIHSRDWCRC